MKGERVNEIASCGSSCSFFKLPFWGLERGEERRGSTDHRPLDIDSHRLSNPRPRPRPRKERRGMSRRPGQRVGLGSTMRFLNSNKRIPPADLPWPPIQPPFNPAARRGRPFDRFLPPSPSAAVFRHQSLSKEESPRRGANDDTPFSRPGLRTNSLRRSYLKVT